MASLFTLQDTVPPDGYSGPSFPGVTQTAGTLHHTIFLTCNTGGEDRQLRLETFFKSNVSPTVLLLAHTVTRIRGLYGASSLFSQGLLDIITGAGPGPGKFPDLLPISNVLDGNMFQGLFGPHL